MSLDETQPILLLQAPSRTFAVVIVRPHDRYGADKQLHNDKGQNLVEFWDLTHPFDPVREGDAQRGQFTGARYYTATLLQDLQPGRALNLHGAVPEWTIPAELTPSLLDFLQIYEPLPRRTTADFLAEQVRQLARITMIKPVLAANQAFAVAMVSDEPEPCLVCATPFISDGESPLCDDCRRGDTHVV